MDMSFYETHFDKLVTQEELDKYSPDNIDNTAYWKELIKNGDLTPFCPIAKSIDDVNYYNGGLLAQSGFFNLSPWPVAGATKVVDIGAGFNSAEKLVKQLFPESEYIPLDIIKHTDTTIVVENEKLPFENESVDVIISSNVFQHLSQNQRNRYIDEIGRTLKKNGLLFLGYCSDLVDPLNSTIKNRVFTEKQEVCTVLGQQVIVTPNRREMSDKLMDKGIRALSTHWRADGYYASWLMKTFEGGVWVN